VEGRDKQEKTDAAVSRSGGAKQASELRARWARAEPAIWTDRMLSALETGVKGGVWFSLIDKVYNPRNLAAAANKVIANKGAPGVDHVTVQQYAQYQQRYLSKLAEALRRNTWHPKAIKRRYIPKPGSAEKRPLGIPCVEDRVVQTALRNAIEPVFEKQFHENSYGFRPGRGCKDALRRVDQDLQSGHVYVVDADLRKFFDTISHETLMKRVEGQVADSRILALIRLFLNQKVMEDTEQWTPEEGTPQGAVISPLLANIFLNPLDHRMAEQGYRMVRYADDSVILCQSEAEAQSALKEMRRWCEDNGLTLHPQKTRIADLSQVGEGFDFLGYRFQRTRNNGIRRWAGEKACKRLRERMRPVTRRTNGQSMQAVIATLNPILRGWCGYFKHSNASTLLKVDRWVRGRLRSILRKRHKRKGKGKGLDHFRWPNRYFAELGLYSLEQAREHARQSFRCNH